MKLPLSWLHQWIQVSANPDEIAEALTTRGFYVEGIEYHGLRYPGIVVARVLEAAKHPNADKLKLCMVDAGLDAPLRIVCGAPNVTAGMAVALATIGTHMPNGMEIKAAKIRGEASQGMLCSARELVLSDEHAGILDLDVFFTGTTLRIGEPIDAYMPEPYAVLEVEVPFNRPDGMGVIGLAREVKAALGGEWTAWARERLSAVPAAATAGGTFPLSITDTDGCASFLAQVVEDVTVQASPPWLVGRLEAMGQRSINNIVDLTNLVLFEFGQPMHAYDLARLAGPALGVRRARPDEKLTTLDGKERELSDEVLLITDADKGVGLGGVMGGLDSEVTSSTTTLLLECAWFRPQRVRRSSHVLGLATEASKRYERGVDPLVGTAAAQRFLALLLELCPGAKLGASAYQHTAPETTALTLRPSRCERLIGLPFTSERCAELLRALEFTVTDGESLAVRVPSWRLDCTLEDDLVEEVARANGYDRIPEARMETRGAFAERSPRERVVRRAREAMLAQGFDEAWSGSLVGASEALAVAPLLGDEPKLVRLANPMSSESEVLRPNLVCGLLRAAAHNLKNGAPAVRLFEVGAGFLDRGDVLPAMLPEERLMLAAVIAGPRWRHAHDAAPSTPAGAYDPRAAADFFDAKGILEAWLGEMRVDSPTWRAYSGAGWKPGASAEVAVAGSRIAWAGTLGQSLLRAWEIDIPVHLIVVLLEPLSEGVSTTPRAKVPGRFPPVRRDLAFFIPRHVTHAQVEQALVGAAGGTLSAWELFDVYEGPGTPEGAKSLAFALQFQHAERTLTEAEVSESQARMVAAVVQGCGGSLRGN